MNTSTIKSRFQTSVLACLVAAGALAPGYHALAQNAINRETADVPFDFRSGSQVMPAGRYEITRISDHMLLLHGSAPRHVLLQQFRETPNAVLFGTSSFCCTEAPTTERQCLPPSGRSRFRLRTTAS